MKRLALMITSVAAAVGWYSEGLAEDRLLAPFITIGEEYTDNVFDTQTERRHDFITRVRPGFISNYQASRFQWNIAYNLDYRYYARNSKTNDISHEVDAKGSITLLENFFFLDLADTYKRVSLDIYRDAVVASAFANQTDQNIATVNPWLLWHPTDRTTLKTGYRYNDIRYWDASGIAKQIHSAHADMTYELTPKVNLLANYLYSHQESVDNRRYDKHDASGGFRYNYADTSFLYANLGYTWQYFSDRTSSRYLFWNAGLKHDFGYFIATLESKRQITEDPLAHSTRETSYQAKLDKTFDRSAIGLFGGYTDYDYIDRAPGYTGGRHKTVVGLTGRYDIGEHLALNATLSGEHYNSYRTPFSGNRPYRLVALIGLSWQIMNDLALNVSYTHISNQRQLDSTDGVWTTNRAVIELKKTF